MVAAPVVAPDATLGVGGGLKVSILIKLADCIARANLSDVVDRIVGQDKGLEIAAVFVLANDDAIDGLVKDGLWDDFLCKMSDWIILNTSSIRTYQSSRLFQSRGYERESRYRLRRSTQLVPHRLKTRQLGFQPIFIYIPTPWSR